MTVIKHVHKYFRPKGAYGRKGFYICKHASCTHRLHKELLVGKMSICNSCGEEFLLDTYALRLAFPHCEKCTKGVAGEKAKKVESGVSSLLEDL